MAQRWNTKDITQPRRKEDLRVWEKIATEVKEHEITKTQYISLICHASLRRITFYLYKGNTEDLSINLARSDELVLQVGSFKENEFKVIATNIIVEFL